ncbi:MAG: glycine zipper 2TM domain-containing protein [Erythrobacter sp.]|nr:glycine zipper 2TM domain-containing protein [Erythrobacter sp.]MBX7461834.1 glycine zipper 2TM domain-containing protein [Qipengyuania huizhouensis]
MVFAAPANAAEPVYSYAPYAGPDLSMAWHHSDDDDDDRWEKRRYRDNRYSRYQGRYYGEPVYRNTRVWRGRDGRVYCRKRDGTTGLIVGGALGAVLGREIDSRGDRSLGTILGAAGGALLGREIERGRCR